MATFYVIEDNEIINAIECDTRAQAERTLTGFVNSDKLRIMEYPPLTMLKRYRYWNERP